MYSVPSILLRLLSVTLVLLALIFLYFAALHYNLSTDSGYYLTYARYILDGLRPYAEFFSPYAPGGVIWSQDGHLVKVEALLRDESFWREDIGCAPPNIDGLGEKKLVRIMKS
jgi:hypothetical protein